MGLLLSTGLKQHKYYLYHEENKVYARMDSLERVMVKEFDMDGDHGTDRDGIAVTAFQAAHDFVQAVVNPEKHHHSKFGKKGFTHPDFQSKISDNCKDTVLAAYKAAGKLPAAAA